MPRVHFFFFLYIIIHLTKWTHSLYKDSLYPPSFLIQETDKTAWIIYISAVGFDFWDGMHMGGGDRGLE